MELASKLRWVIFITIASIILILIGWGLFSIAKNIFVSGPDSSINETLVADRGNEVKSTGSARFIVDGPVVANENHRSYEIEVTNSVVMMKVYKGYSNNQVIAQKSYSNTSAAYDAFLSALANQDVTARKKNTTVDTDFEEIGVCPTGRRYILELDELRRWSSSCSSKQGTADFSMSAVRRLFQKQVPDYGELMRGVRL